MSKQVQLFSFDFTISENSDRPSQNSSHDVTSVASESESDGQPRQQQQPPVKNTLKRKRSFINNWEAKYPGNYDKRVNDFANLAWPTVAFAIQRAHLFWVTVGLDKQWVSMQHCSAARRYDEVERAREVEPIKGPMDVAIGIEQE